jgi:hypothetical protein
VYMPTLFTIRATCTAYLFLLQLVLQIFIL